MNDRSSPSLLEIVEESVNLVAGAVTALLPLFVLSVPIIFPLAVFGGAVAAVLGLAAGLVALVTLGPVLLVKSVVRRVRTRTSPV